MMRICLLILCLFPLLCSAAVYRWVDNKGSVHYSDKPRKGAKKTFIPEVQTYEAQQLRSPSPRVTKDSRLSYSQLVITQPQPETTFRNTTGAVDVQFTLKPELQANDKVQFLLNGKVVASSGSTAGFSFTGINRGTHQIALQVVDGDGKVLIKSRAITIYMHQPRTNMRTQPTSPLNPSIQKLFSPTKKI